MGCLTTYGIGSAPPYYGTGYVPQVCARARVCWAGGGVGRGAHPTHTRSPMRAQAKWYQFGFIFSLIYLSIWLGVGSVWYKAIGIY